MVVRRVGPLSAAKIAGTLYALLGLCFGAVVSMFALAGVFGGAAQHVPGGPFPSALFGVGAVIALPVFYGLMGFVMTAIMAALYNLLASLVGGVEVDLQ